jgi:hypothetical protein
LGADYKPGEVVMVAFVEGVNDEMVVLGRVKSSMAQHSVIVTNEEIATTASVTFANVTISNPPSSANHATTKAYVDSLVAGLDWHEAVRFATATALPNSPTYDNGLLGVGATLTATTNGALMVDGGAVSVGDRLLIKNQSTQAQNGIYVVVVAGSGSTGYALVRSTDFNGSGPAAVNTGEAVFVTAGATNVWQGFVVNSTYRPHQIGVDPIQFTQFTGAQAFTAGDGLTMTGNVINAVGTAGRIAMSADAIDLATVSPSATAGAATTTFVSSVTVDNYGRTTSVVTSPFNFGSVALTGVPTAPTATQGTNTTQIATTAFVNTEIAADAVLQPEYSSKGAIVAGTGTGTRATLPAGANGRYLFTDSAEATGLKWVTLPTATLDDLTDVVISAPSNNQVVRYNGTNWVNSAAPAVAKLDDVVDVVLTSLANGETIQWNNTLQQWVNVNIVSQIVGAAPAALDTLNELAAALGNDANFATTVTNSLALKANIASPTFTGTVTLPADTILPERYSADITATKTFALADRTFVQMCNNTSAISLQIPTNASVAFSIGTTFTIIRMNTAEVTVAALSGVTLLNAVGGRLRDRYSTATLRKIGTDTWHLSGDIKV